MIGEPPVCLKCKHFFEKKGMKCKAFPKGIPYEIILGGNEHKKPLDKQENKIIFEPKEK